MQHWMGLISSSSMQDQIQRVVLQYIVYIEFSTNIHDKVSSPHIECHGNLLHGQIDVYIGSCINRHPPFISEVIYW